MWFMHWMPCALAFVFASVGSSRLARMAMIAMTTSSSINVNARRLPILFLSSSAGERTALRNPRFDFARGVPEPERGPSGRGSLGTKETLDHEAHRTVPTRCGQDG